MAFKRKSKKKTAPKSVDVKSEVEQEVEQVEASEAVEDKSKNKAEKFLFNVELQIMRLGRNESLQMQPVEAGTIEEAREQAVAIRGKHLKEGYSCTATGRYSKEEL